MAWFQRFYLDKEKDIIVDLFRAQGALEYVLSTPNHTTGNLIRNLAKLCGLPLTQNGDGLLEIRGEVPSYIDGYNRQLYILRLGDTKVANIYPDGRVELKAHIPAISKTLMSQTKDYRLDIRKTIVKTYIKTEQKFRTDLHTHMNANLTPDVLIALGICHQIRYPLYYIKKLGLRCSEDQWAALMARRAAAEAAWADCGLQGKYLIRRIDDNTFLNFADLILNNPGDTEYNIPRIRRSLSILKDGQAVFTNLEKVFLYRYVFTKGIRDENAIEITAQGLEAIPDPDIRVAAGQMLADRQNPDYRNNTLFQDKLLWIARGFAARGVQYAEISDTTLVKPGHNLEMLRQAHAVMPAVTRETGVLLRFLAAIRRIPLTIVKDNVVTGDYFQENLEALRQVAADPYVAGSDIVGEELNDIRSIAPVIRALVGIAGALPGFVLRLHAGENDGLRDNIANGLKCVRDALAPGQPMPAVRFGHGLYSADLKRPEGRRLIDDLREAGAVLEFQITSNVRLNNLSDMKNHPLRQYLAGGVGCVQGTDGGGLHGTDSIDEQLSLEKMLGLTDDELTAMRRCEDGVLSGALEDFERKSAAQQRGETPTFPPLDRGISMIGARAIPAAEALAAQIAPLPEDMLPVVVAGGSFNQDSHTTRTTEAGRRVIDAMLETADPAGVFFVVGHALMGYEAYLVRRAAGRFRVFAIVPSMITETECKRLRESGVGVRVSIEPVPMGTYKSFAYEIFKRRPSRLIAFDGNIAGANLIQEAKNSRYPCEIHVNRRCRVLRAKADTLEGYVQVFG